MTEVELWSDKETWDGESVPQKGEEIVINYDKNILIDQDIDVDTIHNFGKLQTKSDKDLNVDVKAIMNIGGKLVIETETNKHKVNVREMVYNQKGEVSIKGKNKKGEDTVDGELLEKSDVITLKGGDGDWAVGEEILIPTMDNNRTKSEVRKITAFDKGTKKITLNESLAYNHTDDNVEAIVINMDRSVELTGKKRGLN